MGTLFSQLMKELITPRPSSRPIYPSKSRWMLLIGKRCRLTATFWPLNYIPLIDSLAEKVLYLSDWYVMNAVFKWYIGQTYLKGDEWYTFGSTRRHCQRKSCVARSWTWVVDWATTPLPIVSYCIGFAVRGEEIRSVDVNWNEKFRIFFRHGRSSLFVL